MIYVETNSIIGSENLAFEEYFLKKEDIREPVLMLWRNRPTIVVGAFQNTHEEICEEFVKANKIDVVRRTSGYKELVWLYMKMFNMTIREEY